MTFEEWMDLFGEGLHEWYGEGEIVAIDPAGGGVVASGYRLGRVFDQLDALGYVGARLDRVTITTVTTSPPFGALPMTEGDRP